MWLVCYDIASGGAGLRRVARICEGAGVRVQKSVFEVDVSDADWVKVRSMLESTVGDADSIRFYAINEANSVVIGEQPPLSRNQVVF